MKLDLKELLAKITGQSEFKTLLWTNPNPDSMFLAQNISIDLSDYDEVEVVAKHWTNNGTTASARCKRTEVGCILVPNGANTHMAFRDWQGYDDHIYIADGRDYYGTSATATSYAGIPLRIYGIRYVGGVVRKLLKALKPLTLGRGWAV